MQERVVVIPAAVNWPVVTAAAAVCISIAATSHNFACGVLCVCVFEINGYYPQQGGTNGFCLLQGSWCNFPKDPHLKNYSIQLAELTLS